MLKIPSLRWSIAGLLFVISILNYIDRQSLALLIPTIQSELRMSDQQYGHIISLFLVAYAVSYFISGRLVDKLGARYALAIFLGIWATADIVSALTVSWVGLGIARFFLGFGEAGGYSTSPKIVSEWFPPKERGIVVGLYSMGSALGATLAPILILAIASRFGWRSAFVCTGVLALFVAVFWWLFYRTPGHHFLITKKERDYLAEAHLTEETSEEVPVSEKAIWKTVLTHPIVWTLLVARMLTDPVWYFFLFWLPKYLHSARGFDQQQLGQTWTIYLAADIGFLFSGFASGWLVKRGRGAPQARRMVMLAGAVLLPLAPLICILQNIHAVFAVAMIIAFAHTIWLGSLSTYIVDLVPRSILGTTFGFIGAGSAVGGLAMNQAVAMCITHFSYAPCFYMMGVLHPLAFLLIWLFARKPWSATTRSILPKRS